MNQPWEVTKEQALQDMGSNSQMGLSTAEIQIRLKKYGLNKLTEPVKTTFWGTFWDEVREPMILLLLVVGVIYSIWGKLGDVITIFTVIVLLVLSEVFTEFRAHSAISALRKLTPTTTPVIRSGANVQVPAEEIVPGDVVPLEAGSRIPADGRIIESFGLQVNESPLTGESMPVNKLDKVLSVGTPLTDRVNMVYAGTTVTAGTGKAVVSATGMDTEFGKIHGIVQEAHQPRTPLQRAMRELSGLLVWVAVAFSVIIPGIGLLQGIFINHQPFTAVYKDSVLTGLSLAFAVIPEELPIIVTMVLGLGAFALAKRHVLIRSLRAAETLGSVTTIVADKTGTITENKMTVSRLTTDNEVIDLPASQLSLSETHLLEAGVMASAIKKSPDGGYSGDPLDVAILDVAKSYGISPEELQSKSRKISEFAFDHQRQMMSDVYEESNGVNVYAKGAPEVILAKCQQIGNRPKTGATEQRVLEQANEMAGQAMRVLAFAQKRADNVPQVFEQAESNLVFLGLVGITDPPREEAAEAIQTTREAGIRTVMVTGDMAGTAQRVAEEVGIQKGGDIITGAQFAGMSDETQKQKVSSTNVFARITPVQKLQIVRALQANNQIVAVTGDGINDAPALKSADIGIAMGEKGTEAAREASGMVLTDDSYSSIVHGVREGRKIVDNLRKGLLYYLSVKIALVLSFIVPLILVLPFPFAPIQIVLLELFMDLAASATFVAEPIEVDAMHRPPRDPRKRFIDRPMLNNMALAALSLASAVLINYLLAYYGGKSITVARTIAFGTWLVGHIYLAFTMRSQRQTVFKLGLTSNPIMLIWASSAILFFILITNVPALEDVVKVTSLNGFEWLMVFGVPFVTIFWHEIKKTLSRG
jgi:Ca2+-transporting ATPase